MTILFISLLIVLLGSGPAVWYVKSLFKGPNYTKLPAFYPFKNKAAEQRYQQEMS